MTENAAKPRRLYVVLDVGLSAGARCAQTAHGVAMFARIYPALEAVWADGYVEVRTAPGRLLVDMVVLLELAGLPVATFREPDLGNAMTVFVTTDAAARHLRHLPRAE